MAHSDQDGPHTEYNGRLHTVELEIYVTADATEQQIGEWLAYELGGGSIACDHPVNETHISRVAVVDIRAENRWSYTDWEASRADGGRSGRSRLEYQRPAAGGVQ